MDTNNRIKSLNVIKMPNPNILTHFQTFPFNQDNYLIGIINRVSVHVKTSSDVRGEIILTVMAAVHQHPVALPLRQLVADMA